MKYDFQYRNSCSVIFIFLTYFLNTWRNSVKIFKKYQKVLYFSFLTRDCSFLLSHFFKIKERKNILNCFLRELKIQLNINYNYTLSKKENLVSCNSLKVIRYEIYSYSISVWDAMCIYKSEKRIGQIIKSHRISWRCMENHGSYFKIFTNNTWTFHKTYLVFY